MGRSDQNRGGTSNVAKLIDAEVDIIDYSL